MLVALCSSSKEQYVIISNCKFQFRCMGRMNYIAGGSGAGGRLERVAETTVLPDGMPMYLTGEQAYNDAIRSGVVCPVKPLE